MRVRQRADVVGSTFVTDAELNAYINASYAELWDLVCKSDPERFTTSANLTVAAGADSTALPADFYQLVGCDLYVSGSPNPWITLTRMPWNERNRWVYTTALWNSFGWSNIRYRLSGQKILFSPVTPHQETIRLWYVPAITTLVNDSDELDGINGWEEYIVVDAAAKVFIKEESDPSPFLAQKQSLIARIQTMAAKRDVGEPDVVQDTTVQGGVTWGWRGY